MKSFQLLALTTVLSTGCATLFAPKQREIRVESHPSGAQVLIDGNPASANGNPVVTPATVAVSNKNHMIGLRKPGYADANCNINSSLRWYWLVLDIFSVGSVVVDAVTNDWTEVRPEPCMAALRKTGGEARVVLTRESIDIHEKVQFETGKADIRPESFGLLDEVARVIVEHPQIALVEVQGHTDSTGSGDINKRLSDDRAAAVARYLQGKGVTRDRLRWHGFGADVPLDDNRTETGRERNRRVEFHIVKQG